MSPALAVGSLPLAPPGQPSQSPCHFPVNSYFNLVAQVVKNLPAMQEIQVEVGNGNPLQHSCLKNSMDWGGWWAAVHGVTKSWTPLKQLGTYKRLHFLFLLVLTRLPSAPPTVGSGPLHVLLFFPSYLPHLLQLSPFSSSAGLCSKTFLWSPH